MTMPVYLRRIFVAHVGVTVTRAPAPAVNFYGWAFDPDTDNAIRVDVHGGDGLPKPGVNPGTNATANGSRPDVATAHPGHSANHGYGASSR